MSPYSKTAWVANVTPVTAASMNNIESGIASMAAPAPSTTPPASPADGDIWFLPADATNGAIWQMRYNSGSASAYKWEYVGGAAKVFDYDAGNAAFNNAAYATALSYYWWVNAAGSVFPVPRSGDYDVRCKMQMANTAGAAQTFRLAAAGTTTTPTIAGLRIASLIVAAGAEATLFTAGRIVGVTTGAGSVGMAWNADTPGSTQIKAVWVEITPVRVS